MKKIYFISFFMLIAFVISAQHYELKEIVDGNFSPQGVKSMVSSADGLHYYQMNDDNSAVIKFAYTSGDVVDTLFNTDRKSVV